MDTPSQNEVTLIVHNERLLGSVHNGVIEMEELICEEFAQFWYSLAAISKN